MIECKECGVTGYHKRGCTKQGVSIFLPAPVPEVIYCPAQTYRQTRDTPAEHCENEVEDYGDLCPEHEESDRADEAYERERDARYDY